MGGLEQIDEELVGYLTEITGEEEFVLLGCDHALLSYLHECGLRAHELRYDENSKSYGIFSGQSGSDRCEASSVVQRFRLAFLVGLPGPSDQWEHLFHLMHRMGVEEIFVRASLFCSDAREALKELTRALAASGYLLSLEDNRVVPRLFLYKYTSQETSDERSFESCSVIAQLVDLTDKQAGLLIEYHRAVSDGEMELAQCQADLAQCRKELAQCQADLAQCRKEWEVFWQSRAGRLIRTLEKVRGFVAPKGSRRDHALCLIFAGIDLLKSEGFWTACRVAWEVLLRRADSLRARIWLYFRRSRPGEICDIEPVEERSLLPLPRTQCVDIVICVHNALDYVQRCLESIREHTSLPYRLIIVDDGSDVQTAEFLADFAQRDTGSQVLLIRNEQACGYTVAANQGIKASEAEYVLLLNSDTIVTPGWLERLVDCAERDQRIGMVGPLSNTASWQSVPKVEENGDWATNPLPTGVTPAEMGRLVAKYSGRVYPYVPFLNGFCLLLRKQMLLDVGLFDEERFGQGYGEEDDLALRARKKGWHLALADDAYVWHAQSRSYSTERRRQLCERAQRALIAKHGFAFIQRGVDYCRGSLVLEGIRARVKAALERERWSTAGERYAGKSILFVLPIWGPGGGGNVIVTEGLAMARMGVRVEIFNCLAYQDRFVKSYPDLSLPVLFGEVSDLPRIARRYDVVVATHNSTVRWLLPVVERCPSVRLGYYVQGFEPLMYNAGSEEYQRAMDSYILIPEMTCFTKTQWTRDQVLQHTGRECHVVGPSVDIDLFRPRPDPVRENTNRPLRIAAMVRPESPYREPGKTMLLLKQAYRKYGARVEIVIFGTTYDNPGFQRLTIDFPWKLYGVLPSQKVARLLNTVDIFVDYSSHQAMGLTALEAMATGCAVIVPQEGGATTFALHEHNALVVDTSSFEAVWEGLERLIEDRALREKLQRNAVWDVCQYPPERAALGILNCLFVDG